jgi:hypothetical protein
MHTDATNTQTNSRWKQYVSRLPTNTFLPHTLTQAMLQMMHLCIRILPRSLCVCVLSGVTFTLTFINKLAIRILESTCCDIESTSNRRVILERINISWFGWWWRRCGGCAVLHLLYTTKNVTLSYCFETHSNVGREVVCQWWCPSTSTQ